MLFQVLNRMIDRGATNGLREKVDVLYATGRLTDEEYQSIAERLV